MQTTAKIAYVEGDAVVQLVSCTRNHTLTFPAFFVITLMFISY
jgi:hypothetical protein